MENKNTEKRQFCLKKDYPFESIRNHFETIPSGTFFSGPMIHIASGFEVYISERVNDKVYALNSKHVEDNTDFFEERKYTGPYASPQKEINPFSGLVCEVCGTNLESLRGKSLITLCPRCRGKRLEETKDEIIKEREGKQEKLPFWWKDIFDELIKMGFVYWNDSTKYDYLCFPEPFYGNYRIFPNKDPNSRFSRDSYEFFRICKVDEPREGVLMYAETIEDIQRFYFGFSWAKYAQVPRLFGGKYNFFLYIENIVFNEKMLNDIGLLRDVISETIPPEEFSNANSQGIFLYAASIIKKYYKSIIGNKKYKVGIMELSKNEESKTEEPDNLQSHCKNCRFWVNIPDKGALSEKQGVCENEKFYGSPNFKGKDDIFDFIMVSNCGCGRTYVGADFGCIHFDKLKNREKNGK